MVHLLWRFLSGGAQVYKILIADDVKIERSGIMMLIKRF